MVRFVRLSPFALVFLLMRSLAAEADMCAIDMGSNSVRRIVGSFANGRYAQRSMEVHTLSVGDDARGRVRNAFHQASSIGDLQDLTRCPPRP